LSDGTIIMRPRLTHLAAIACGLIGACALSGCEHGALGGGGKSAPRVRVKLAAEAGDSGGGGTEEVVTVAGYGTFTGRVVLDGADPGLTLSLPATMPDPNVCQRPLIPNERLIVGEGNGIKNVFVYLARKPAGTKDAAAPPEQVIFDQKACTFVPHALIARTGQEVRLINSDPIAHNVNLKPNSNEPFNNILKVSDQVGVPYTYKRGEREPVRVVCDIHSWMLAWQLPLDHPYGAVTNENGEFTIPDLPAGQHRFVVWHEGRKLADHPVTIEVDQTATGEIKVPSTTFAQAAPARGLKTVVISVAGN
jgi:plastocyanin